jgi:hypothetical protein
MPKPEPRYIRPSRSVTAAVAFPPGVIRSMTKNQPTPAETSAGRSFAAP